MFPRRKYDAYDAEEMTVVRMDKRASTSPPPRIELAAGQSQRQLELAAEQPRIPYNRMPRFEEQEQQRPSYGRSFDRDDEPTQMYGSRPLLSMQSQVPAGRSVIVDQTHETPPPPVSSRLLPDAPRSAAAVDPASSAHVRAVDMSMTASLSGSTDIANLRRPTMGWATALVAVGVFAGIITAFVARGEGLATAAAFVDPSHQVTADITKAAGGQMQAQAQPQAVETQLKPGAGAVVVQSSQKPAAPSCDATVVAPKVEAKETAKVEVPVVVARIEKPVVQHMYVAPVHHEAAQPVVAQASPPPAITKPVVAKPAHHASSNDMDSANAADALAKAQLEAALSR
jgi:hypothetical protein